MHKHPLTYFTPIILIVLASCATGDLLTQPNDDLIIEAWSEDQQMVYDVGDPLIVHFRVTEPAYVTIYSFNTGGGVLQLFPNRDTESNKVNANKVYTIPGPNADVYARAPVGMQRMLFIASHANVEWHSPFVLDDNYYFPVIRYPGKPENEVNPLFEKHLSLVFSSIPADSYSTANLAIRIRE